MYPSATCYFPQFIFRAICIDPYCSLFFSFLSIIPSTYIREFLLCINLVETLGCNVNSSWALVEMANLPSEVVVLNNIFISDIREFLILLILANVWLSHFWGFTFLKSVKNWASFSVFFGHLSSLQLPIFLLGCVFLWDLKTLLIFKILIFCLLFFLYK